MIHHGWSCGIVLFAGILCSTWAMAQEKVFLAGAATSNITPPLGELIVGNWVPVPAAHIHDELHARCLLLNDGETTIGFVLCDNVGIPREVFDAARRQLMETTDLNVDHILMAATHTHSATVARGGSKVKADRILSDYQSFLATRICDAVRRASKNLQPARIGWGSVNEPSELFNRRWFVTDPELLKNPFGGVDQVRMNPPANSKTLVRPAGPTDPELSFLSVQTREGKPLALLANYSLHYVGGVPAGDVSADYFGVFSDLISQHFQPEREFPPFVAMMSNGTSGDVNNINFAGERPSRKHYEQMQLVAEKLANRVIEAEKKITYQDWVKLGSAKSLLKLNVRKPTPEMIEYLEEVLKLPKGDRHLRADVYLERLQVLDQDPPTVDVPLQVLRIGDLAIQAIPFEVFAETGLELKDKTPFADAFTIELANGSFGYLPTPAQHELGGYETWIGTNNVQLDATELIVERLLELSQQLQQEK